MDNCLLLLFSVPPAQKPHVTHFVFNNYKVSAGNSGHFLIKLALFPFSQGINTSPRYL